MSPETLEVEINYRIPEPVVVNMGAGIYSLFRTIKIHQLSAIDNK